jgi:hypothetical protein
MGWKLAGLEEDNGNFDAKSPQNIVHSARSV